MTVYAAPQTAQQTVAAESAESGFEKHFVRIAFTLSALALLILAPLQFCFGAAMGVGIHFLTERYVSITDPVVTLPNALFAIVGAAAALIRLTPSGAAGGLLFQAIPVLGSISVGSTLYRGLALF